MSARVAIAALLVLAVAALLRLPALDADPAAGFHFAFITDEGQYAHNARQQALFGRRVMDDHNDALYTAPLHTALLERSYAWSGVSVAATRRPGAVAGVLTSVLIVLLLAGRVAARAAFAAGLLVAGSIFAVTHARVAFTESLQLLGATLAVLGTWRARAGPLWGAAAAVGLCVALAAKLSSAPLIAVAGAQWLWLVRDARRAGEGRVAARAALAFGAVAAAAGLAAAWLLLPRAGTALAEFGGMARLAVAGDMAPLQRFLWFGFREDPGGVRVLGGLFAQEPALVLGAAWLAAAGWLGRRTPGDRFLVVSLWLWTGLMFAAIATHPALSPDRRYLLLLPAPAVLLALAAFEPPRAPAVVAPGGRSLRRTAAWATLALVPGFYLRAGLIGPAGALLAHAPIGAEAGLSDRAALALGWLLAGAAAAVIVALPVSRRLLRPAAWPARALIAWLLAAGLTHGIAQIARPTFTLRDASRAFGARVAQSPPERRVALGSIAETLSLENELRCMVVRDWGAGIRMNVGAPERLERPWLILAHDGERVIAWSESFRVEDAAVVERRPVWPDRRGVPRFEVLLCRMGGDRAAGAARLPPIPAFGAAP